MDEKKKRAATRKSSDPSSDITIDVDPLKPVTRVRGLNEPTLIHSTGSSNNRNVSANTITGPAIDVPCPRQSRNYKKTSV